MENKSKPGDPIKDMHGFTLGPHGIGTFDGKPCPGYIVMKDGEEFKHGNTITIKRDDGDGHSADGTFPTKEYWHVESFIPDDTTQDLVHMGVLMITVKHCDTCQGNGMINVNTCSEPGCLVNHIPNWIECGDCNGTGHIVTIKTTRR